MLVRPSPLPQLRAKADLRAAIHREDAVLSRAESAIWRHAASDITSRIVTGAGHLLART
jgi:hypothetical protein